MVRASFSISSDKVMVTSIWLDLGLGVDYVTGLFGIELFSLISTFITFKCEMLGSVTTIYLSIFLYYVPSS